MGMVGRNIKKIRLSLNLNTDDIAKKLGISRSYLTLIENEKRNFPKKLVKKLSNTLKIPLKQLYPWFLDEYLEKLKS